MPVFPTALSALAINKTDTTTSPTDHPGHHNAMADEINAIEAELGVTPSGSFATVAARFAAESTVRKTADQTNSTTTLTNVTDLAFPVTVGADHFFEFWVPYSSAATTTGVGFAVTVPTLGTGGYITYTAEITGRAANPALAAEMALTSVMYLTHHEASGQAVAAGTAGVAVANAVYMARVEGVLSNPSAAGNIQLQHRSEVAAASTVKKGAFGRMYVN